MPRTIAIVAFEGAEELDFVGPWEVFTMAAAVVPGSCTVHLVSEHGGEVRCAKGLRVVADHSFETVPTPDIVVVPGGQGTRIESSNPAMLAFLTKSAKNAELVTSVCTGSFVLERAGLLTGKRATTHWASMDRLRALGTVNVVEKRWLDEGNVITSSGVSSGIDMALHITGRLWGEGNARLVQKAMEYFPDPPYQEIPIPDWPR
ncbi:MAG: DJ-1/PfpI family protein [Anaerolineaceae bacterium]